ncbi:MAG: hypothetical protein [Microvirus sp.]|nr:MAG: hypothetical protein [Microvirus sp.]
MGMWLSMAIKIIKIIGVSEPIVAQILQLIKDDLNGPT